MLSKDVRKLLHTSTKYRTVDQSNPLKVAMVCKRNIQCQVCKSYITCQNVLAKRYERELSSVSR